MGACDFLVGISAHWCGLVGGLGGRTAGSVGGLRRCRRIVGFEYVKTLQLLVQYSKRLELLRLVHLRLEPVLDLILLLHYQVLVIVVKMSGTGQD
jgi:hypothetical protein